MWQERVEKNPWFSRLPSKWKDSHFGLRNALEDTFRRHRGLPEEERKRYLEANIRFLPVICSETVYKRFQAQLDQEVEKLKQGFVARIEAEERKNGKRS
jgi:hypothetical protein